MNDSGPERIEHSQAVAINEQRRAEAIAFFKRGSYTEEQLSKVLLEAGLAGTDLIGIVRSETRLRSAEIDGVKYYPAWQLKDGLPRTDLDAINAQLDVYTKDVFSQDRVMRLTEHDELGGATIVVALDDPDYHDRAVAKLRRLGDGF